MACRSVSILFGVPVKANHQNLRVRKASFWYRKRMKIHFVIFTTFLTFLHHCQGLNCFDCVYYQGVPEYDHHGAINQCMKFKTPQPKNKPPNGTDINVKAVLCPPSHKSCVVDTGRSRISNKTIVMRGCSNETFVGCRMCKNDTESDPCSRSQVFRKQTGKVREGRKSKVTKNDLDLMARGSDIARPQEDILRQRQCFCQSDRCNGHYPLAPLHSSFLCTLWTFLGIFPPFT